MSDQEEQLIQALIAAAPGIRDENFALVALSTWVIWDWIISIDIEVEHFWKKKWTTGSYLYFSNRLLAVVLIIVHFQTSVRPLNVEQTNQLCIPLASIVLIVTGLSNFIIQIVLVLRTYALWDGSKLILWSLMILSIASTLIQETILGFVVANLTVIYNPLPAPYSGCFVIAGKWNWQRWPSILVFEIVVAGCLLIKFLKFYREGRSSRIAHILYRDGFVEFICVMVTSMFSFIVPIIRANQQFQLITFDVSAALAIVVCARMLLNIRDVMRIQEPRIVVDNNTWRLTELQPDARRWMSDSE